MTIEVRGAEELNAKLGALVRDLAGGGLDSELEQAGRQLAADESSRAPRVTGTLADAIEVRLDDHVAKITLTAPYAPPVVAGVTSRGIPPRPIADQAAASAEESLSRLIEAGVADAIRRAGLD